ncbi:MAG: TonB-dependent receptor plug domain-containing protein [Tannerella sp.]|jgi:TonB-dependent SusC/RagA subfamily outer membrane receptor|nr:TonB-dependent receptor plug domain-containing protein [Tannerella sp.]
MKNAIIFFLTLALSVHASQATAADTPADTLVGLVVNPKGKGLKNIPVTARHRDGVFKTDRKGIFVIPNVLLDDTLMMVIPKNRIFVVPVTGKPFLKVILYEDDFTTEEARDEIVDLGYGQVRKLGNTSGNVVISGDELRLTGQNDILDAIAGKVPGVNIVYSDDGTPTLSIRGGASFSLDNSPLLILDGSAVDSFHHVNINDVEEVTVMKEASIYGARGANGAVLIKTK